MTQRSAYTTAEVIAAGMALRARGRTRRALSFPAGLDSVSMQFVSWRSASLLAVHTRSIVRCRYCGLLQLFVSLPSLLR